MLRYFVSKQLLRVLVIQKLQFGHFLLHSFFFVCLFVCLFFLYVCVLTATVSLCYNIYSIVSLLMLYYYSMLFETFFFWEFLYTEFSFFVFILQGYSWERYKKHRSQCIFINAQLRIFVSKYISL